MEHEHIKGENQKYLDLAIECGYFPPIQEDTTPNDIREVLVSYKRLNLKEQNNTVRVPQAWEENTTFYLGHISDEGFVWKVDIDRKFKDGTRSVIEASQGIQERKKRFFEENPHLIGTGERGYIAWLNSETPDY